MYRGGEIAERVPALHTAGAGNGLESGHGSFAGGASAPEAGFSPLYGAPQGAFGRVVGWFDAFRFKKHEDLLTVHEQRRGEVAHILVVAVGIAVRRERRIFSAAVWTSGSDRRDPG